MPAVLARSAAVPARPRRTPTRRQVSYHLARHCDDWGSFDDLPLSAPPTLKRDCRGFSGRPDSTIRQLGSGIQLDRSPTPLSGTIPSVRFGSKADICAATSDVCFTPDSDHESGHVPMVMSAVPP